MGKIRRTGLPVERKILRLPRGKQVKVKSKKQASISYSRKFKSFVRRNKGAFLEAFRLIEKNLEQLNAGTVIEGNNGMRIEKAATGMYKGKFNLSTIKVAFNGKQFFVKKCAGKYADENLRGAFAADALLNKKGYKIGGFNVRVLFPHLVYSRRGKGYVVSDYFNEREVKQVRDYHGKNRHQIDDVLTLLNILGKGSIRDIMDLNAFYQPSTRTILLFDLYVVSTQLPIH